MMKRKAKGGKIERRGKRNGLEERSIEKDGYKDGEDKEG